MKIKGNLSLFAKPHGSVNISPSAEFREVVMSTPFRCVMNVRYKCCERTLALSSCFASVCEWVVNRFERKKEGVVARVGTAKVELKA